MRILYAIQGTGNGHLARATEIVPILKSIADTDILVSGTQSDLKVPFQIDYRFAGMSYLIGQSGGVDILKTIQKMHVLQFIKDIKNLPLNQYDLVINDFEPVSAWACRLRNKACIGLSHQNAVLHPSAPQPNFNDLVGKFILNHYAPVSHKYGFNFSPFSPDIFPPVIRQDIRNAKSTVKPYFTVYLPAYSDQQIQDVLSRVPDTDWQVFSKHSKTNYTVGSVHFHPVSLNEFTQSFLNCAGLICTAGFEGPAEAIFMGKKLCVIPMKKQYEQYCNAAFLKTMGIKVLSSFSKGVPDLIDWVKHSVPLEIKYPDLTYEILSGIVARHKVKETSMSFHDLKLEFARLLARQGTLNF